MVRVGSVSIHNDGIKDPTRHRTTPTPHTTGSIPKRNDSLAVHSTLIIDPYDPNGRHWPIPPAPGAILPDIPGHRRPQLTDCCNVATSLFTGTVVMRSSSRPPVQTHADSGTIPERLSGLRPVCAWPHHRPRQNPSGRLK